jgi:hypothetical protein
MKIDKGTLWNILEKYDTKEYEALCDGLSNIIKEKEDINDFLNIYNYYDKIDNSDRKLIEDQVGYKITGALFSI